MAWIQLAILAVSIAVSLVLRPRPPSQKQPSVEDFKIPTADETRPIPVVFGTVTVTGPNVVWYGDLGYSPIRTSSGK